MYASSAAPDQAGQPARDDLVPDPEAQHAPRAARAQRTLEARRVPAEHQQVLVVEREVRAVPGGGVEVARVPLHGSPSRPWTALTT